MTQNIFRVTHGAKTLNLSFRIDSEIFFINDPQTMTVKDFFGVTSKDEYILLQITCI